MSEANIMMVWERADAIDRYEGIMAYQRYNATMQEIGAAFCFSLESVVGAFCALSPNNDYIGNLRSLVTLLSGFNAGVACRRSHCVDLRSLQASCLEMSRRRGLFVIH